MTCVEDIVTRYGTTRRVGVLAVRVISGTDAMTDAEAILYPAIEDIMYLRYIVSRERTPACTL
ncbi:MAG: hypothetical protein WDA42_03565 [Candidatus Bathyarchaeia archaeon]|jgi:hypothetical protein